MFEIFSFENVVMFSELYETKYSVRYDPVLGDWIPGYDSTHMGI